jgi:hypothetical protein
MMGNFGKLAKNAVAVSPNRPTCHRFMSSAPGRKTVTLIPGDGIGPEIAAAVQR